MIKCFMLKIKIQKNVFMKNCKFINSKENGEELIAVLIFVLYNLFKIPHTKILSS